MNLPSPLQERIAFLTRVVGKEMLHLRYSSTKIFSGPLTLQQVLDLDDHPDFAEQLEAYSSRFCRLQDTLGDKFLPAWLEALGESKRSVVDNLDRANQLGIQIDPDEWLVMRQLRNQMIHECIEAKEVFLNALNTAHAYEPTLFHFANQLIEDLAAHKSARQKIK